MMKFFTQMLRYPLTIFVSTMEAFVGVMRDIQKTTDQTIDAMVGGVAQALGNAPSQASVSMGSHETGSVISDEANKTTIKEDGKMADQDLSGTGLKYVSYSILFTKPDLEATLEQQQEDLVNYSTDGASYGALKIAEFFKTAGTKGVGPPRPPVWVGNNYPDGKDGFDPNDPTIWKIPPEDRKYVAFIYQVDRRLDKQDPNYPRDQVKVLKEIRDKIPS